MILVTINFILLYTQYRTIFHKNQSFSIDQHILILHFKDDLNELNYRMYFQAAQSKLSSLQKHNAYMFVGYTVG